MTIIYLLLITFYLLLFAFLAWHRLNWALVLILFALPAYQIRFQVGPLPLTLLESMILILFIVWLIKRNYGLRVTGYGLRISILLFLLAATISIFVSPDIKVALGIWKAYFIEPLLFLIVFISTIKNHEELKLMFKALGLSALIISVFAIIQKFTGWLIPNPFWQAEATRRVTSFFPYPNAVGLYLAPIIILSFGQLSFKKKLIVNSYWLVVIIAAFAAIIFAKSEGAIIAVLAGFIFMGLAVKKSRWWTMGLTVLVIIIVLVVPTWRTFAVQKATFQDVSGQIRLAQWRETWQMLKDRPILGAGLAGYQKTIELYHQEGIFFNKEKDPDFQRKIVIFDEKYKQKFWQPVEIYLYPHNIIFNFWSETGLLGLIAFIWIVISFFYLGSKNNLQATSYKLQAIIIMSAMLAIIIHGFVDVPYFKNDLSVMFWVIVGMMVVVPSLKVTCLPAGREGARRS